jgi:hypothetical protein
MPCGGAEEAEPALEAEVPAVSDGMG